MRYEYRMQRLPSDVSDEEWTHRPRRLRPGPCHSSLAIIEEDEGQSLGRW